MKTLHLNWVSFIYKMMQASEANDSESECSKTGLCITITVLVMLSRGNTWKPFKCDRGPIFQVTDLNRNLKQFRSSEIHNHPDPTARNGSLDMCQPEIWRIITSVFWSLRKTILKSLFSSNRVYTAVLFTQVSATTHSCIGYPHSFFYGINLYSFAYFKIYTSLTFIP